MPDERPADSSNGNDAEAWFDEGWNACRAEMLKAQQNEPQNIPENIPAQPVSEPYKLPSGWKLVPLEPTSKMRIAGKHAIKGCDSIFENVISECVYGAMVNAAPAQESE